MARACVLLAAAALLAAALPGAVAPMPPRPGFLTPASFARAHPKGCGSATPLWASYEWWWGDDFNTGNVQPLGHLVQSSCYPYNQVLERTGDFDVEFLHHRNPAIFRDKQLQMTRPEGADFVKRQVAPLTACKDDGLISSSAVGCEYNMWRPTLSPKLCVLGKGKPTSHNISDDTDFRMSCTWTESIPYNTNPGSSAPGLQGAGNALIQLRTNHYAESDVVQQFNRTSTASPATRFFTSISSRTIQVTGLLPVVLKDSTKYACGDTPKYCTWASEDIYRVQTSVWSKEMGAHRAGISPVYLVPVGGLYRMALSASGSNNPVTRHIITFDDNFRASPPDAGDVYRNATGSLGEYDMGLPTLTERVVFKSINDVLTPGWHKMTVQAKSADRLTGGVQTASVSTYIQVAPPCPPVNTVPFVTHALKDSGGKLEIKVFRLTTEAALKSNSDTLASPYDAYPFAFYWVNLYFDLSWLNAATKVSAASVFLYLSQPFSATQTLNKDVAVELYDSTVAYADNCAGTLRGCSQPAPDVPCVSEGLVCNGVKIGEGTFNTDDGYTFLELKFTKPSYVDRFVGKAQPMAVTMFLPRARPAGDNTLDGFTFRTVDSDSPPLLQLRASCTAPRGR